jgi:hypothetical protein
VKEQRWGREKEAILFLVIVRSDDDEKEGG